VLASRVAASGRRARPGSSSTRRAPTCCARSAARVTDAQVDAFVGALPACSTPLGSRHERGPGHDPCTILVVEDDPSVRGLLQTLLSAEGYDVVTASDGLAGLVKARRRTRRWCCST
jgi:hypothetical protein